jgi:hypothetical protein
MKNTIETTKKNLEEAYDEKWFILEKTIVCPALELIFSVDEFGALNCQEDRERVSKQQDKKAGIVDYRKYYEHIVK